MLDQTPQPVVATLPDEIDAANADSVRDQLSAALASGATIVIADLTSTTFCDSAGFRSLKRADEKAAASGIQLRVVISPDGMVTRALKLLELESMLRIYPSLQAALAAEE